MSGTAIAATVLSPESAVIGAEPEGADDAFRSLAAGKIIPAVNPQTIADGLRLHLVTSPFPFSRNGVEQIVTVSEGAIVEAMRFVWERTKLIIEPSAAVAVAALWEHKIDLTGPPGAASSFQVEMWIWIGCRGRAIRAVAIPIPVRTRKNRGGTSCKKFLPEPHLKNF